MKALWLSCISAVALLAEISVSEAQSQKMGIIAQEIRLIRSQSIGPLIGTIDYGDKGAKNYTLGSEATVVELSKFKGDEVKKGEVICKIASSELLGYVYELKDLRHRLKMAAEFAAKDKQLYNEGVISSRESQKSMLEAGMIKSKIGEIESRFSFAGADSKMDGGMMFAIRAKQNGILSEAPQKAGEKIEPYRPYLKIVSSQSLNAYLRVPPKLMGSIQKNSIVLDSQGRAIGKIVSFAGSVDTVNNSATAVAVLNGSSPYRPGTSLEFFIETPVNEKWALLPRSAVTKYKQKEICFLKTPKGYDAKTVEVKKIYKDHIAVDMKGFTPKTKVATSGTITLKGLLSGMGFE